MNQPTLGQTEAVFKDWGTGYSDRYSVQVREYKFDSIRQESYWVTQEFRSYRTEKDARKFAQRFPTVVFLQQKSV